MPYLLDTNHCSYVINGTRKAPNKQKPQESKVIGTFRATSELLYTCDVVAGEMYYGAALKNNRDELYALIDDFLSTTIPLSANKDCWQLFAHTKAALRLNGKTISDFDLLIACIAYHHGCVIVSNDEAFRHLPASFQVENWAV